VSDDRGPPLMVLPESALRKAAEASGRRGHAAPPGTGPEGETCKTCRHLHRNEMAKTYLKCLLMRQHWTGGAKTDVRAKDAACRRWEAKGDDDG
jgi:hypothetical protein